MARIHHEIPLAVYVLATAGLTTCGIQYAFNYNNKEFPWSPTWENAIFWGGFVLLCIAAATTRISWRNAKQRPENQDTIFLRREENAELKGQMLNMMPQPPSKTRRPRKLMDFLPK